MRIIFIALIFTLSANAFSAICEITSNGYDEAPRSLTIQTGNYKLVSTSEYGSVTFPFVEKESHLFSSDIWIYGNLNPTSLSEATVTLTESLKLTFTSVDGSEMYSCMRN